MPEISKDNFKEFKLEPNDCVNSEGISTKYLKLIRDTDYETLEFDIIKRKEDEEKVINKIEGKILEINQFYKK